MPHTAKFEPLNTTHNSGYHDLHGIDINPYALHVLANQYPELRDDVKVTASPLEDKIIEFDNNEFDICFTMAVLEHVHPDSNWVFEEMARITDEYIIVIEDEGKTSWKHVPRKYDELFTSIGCELVETYPRSQFPDTVELPSSFTAHIFET